jgi:hypothetical protein
VRSIDHNQHDHRGADNHHDDARAGDVNLHDYEYNDSGPDHHNHRGANDHHDDSAIAQSGRPEVR